MSCASKDKNNFDSLRIIFATLVIYSHSFPLLRGSNATEPLSRLTHGTATLGEISVWSFFIISGFLITESWRRTPRIGHFLKRRISRIYPGFVMVTLLCALFVYPIAADNQKAVLLIDYVSHVSQLKMFNEAGTFLSNPLPNAINGSLWSIPFEFWCYLGVAALGLSELLEYRYPLVVILLATMAAHLIIEARHLRPGGKFLGVIFGYPVFWSILLPFFLCGMLFNLFRKHIVLRTRYAIAAFCLLAGSILVPHLSVFSLPVLGTYLVMWLAFFPRLNVLNLGRYGDFSYGIYLYAFPVQQLLIHYLPRGLTPARLFLLSVPLTLLCGIASWHILEKRFLSRRTTQRFPDIPGVALG